MINIPAFNEENCITNVFLEDYALSYVVRLPDGRFMSNVQIVVSHKNHKVSYTSINR